uniref:Uncharacterized protein n=1 Tax=Rhizophora mucronata TaxID=61149 RepID=A0A2P2QSL4_RHIMU
MSICFAFMGLNLFLLPVYEGILENKVSRDSTILISIKIKCHRQIIAVTSIYLLTNYVILYCQVSYLL